MKSTTITSIVCIVALVGSPSWAVSLNQKDIFEGGTTEG